MSNEDIDHRIGNQNAVKEEAKDSKLIVRITSRVKSGYVKQAKKEDKNLSTWVTEILNAAVDDKFKQEKQHE